jgi:hypothetical protein
MKQETKDNIWFVIGMILLGGALISSTIGKIEMKNEIRKEKQMSIEMNYEIEKSFAHLALINEYHDRKDNLLFEILLEDTPKHIINSKRLDIIRWFNSELEKLYKKYNEK